MFHDFREQYYPHVLGEEIVLYWNAIDQSDGDIQVSLIQCFLNLWLKCYPKIVSDGMHESSDFLKNSPQKEAISYMLKPII